MEKSLEDKPSRAVEVGDSLAIDLARWYLERETSECNKGYVIRSRLKRVPNEAVKCNALAHEEKVRRFLFQHIESFKSPNGRVLSSNRVMRDTFQPNFRDRFARCPDLPVQEFRRY